MKLAAGIATLLVLLGYLALMSVDPRYGILHPRGGIVMLGLSLTFANAAIWAGQQSHRPLHLRFQLVVAGWIWILVQAGGHAYLYSHASGS